MSRKVRHIYRKWARVLCNPWRGLPFILAGIPLDVQRAIYQEPSPMSGMALEAIHAESEDFNRRLNEFVGMAKCAGR